MGQKRCKYSTHEWASKTHKINVKNESGAEKEKEGDADEKHHCFLRKNIFVCVRSNQKIIVVSIALEI